MTTLLDRAAALEQDILALRRDLHRHPELSFQETRTAAEAARRVGELGFHVRTGVARTGVIAELHNGNGPVVALRASMDALPLREANDVPYRSVNDGAMHACGHDAHVAMLVGAATLLSASRAEGSLPAGTVRLLFQPSEERADRENKSGARRMIEEGALDGADALFSAHAGAHLATGSTYVRSGPILAGADAFTAIVAGRGAHAAHPQDGVDAIVLAAHAILGCQSLLARLDPVASGMLNVGIVQGGSADELIAERVTLRGTLRYLDEGVRGTLHRELRNAFAMTQALGGRVKLDVLPGTPPVVNDAHLAHLARAAIEKTCGPVVADFPPMMDADDFAFYHHLVPGCLLWIGAALQPERQPHTPTFDIDERALPRGAAALAACAIAALRDPAD